LIFSMRILTKIWRSYLRSQSNIMMRLLTALFNPGTTLKEMTNIKIIVPGSLSSFPIRAPSAKKRKRRRTKAISAA